MSRHLGKLFWNILSSSFIDFRTAGADVLEPAVPCQVVPLEGKVGVAGGAGGAGCLPAPPDHLAPLHGLVVVGGGGQGGPGYRAPLQVLHHQGVEGPGHGPPVALDLGHGGVLGRQLQHLQEVPHPGHLLLQGELGQEAGLGGQQVPHVAGRPLAQVGGPGGRRSSARLGPVFCTSPLPPTCSSTGMDAVRAGLKDVD